MTTLPISTLGRHSLALGALALSAGLVGCSMGDHSNPTLSISSARVQGEQATFNLVIENPSDADLTLTGIDYTVIYGPLPVAEGQWTGEHPLPSKGILKKALTVQFDSPPIDPSERMIELTGDMLFGKGDAGAMEIHTASFSESTTVR